MMGSVADTTWPAVKWLAVFVVVGASLLIYWAREIDLLSLGDDAAAALGVNVDVAARRIYMLAAVLAAATVAAAGLIGFVGLIVPHIVRASGIRSHRPLIIAAGLVGASLVVGSDLAARTIRPPAELPLGAITAVLGVPFFLAQLRKAR
jgi:iron complex transport system permease protein